MADISRKQFEDAKARVQHFIGRAKVAAEKSKSVIRHVLRTGVVTGAGFATGVMQGKTLDAATGKALTLVGVPFEVLGGLASHGAGFLLKGGERIYLHAAGDGILCAYTSLLGRGLGRNWAQTGSLSSAVSRGSIAQSAMSGNLPAGEPAREGVGATHLSDHDMAESVRRA